MFAFNAITTMYLSYVLLSVVATIWVGRTLAINSEVFLARRFQENKHLAHATSHLLAVGFYLFHIGVALLLLKTTASITDGAGVLEVLSAKIGVVLFVLAASHFTHVLFYSRLKPGEITGC
jgi:hypothetical protein